MLRVLRSSCSWSQVFYQLTKRSATQSSSFAKRAQAFCTSAQCQISVHHKLHLESLQRTQQNQLLQCLRFISSHEERDNDARSVDEKMPIRSPVAGAKISRKRLEWQAAFRDVISSKEISEWQSSDWDQIAGEPNLPRGPSWEILCMHTLYQDKNLVLGKNLMNYLEQKAQPVNHILLTFYVGLLGVTSTTPEQDDETKAVFDCLLETTELLDPASMEVLSSGLSHTKYYRECIRLIEMCREVSTLSTPLLINTLIGSIRFKDLDLLKSTLSIVEETFEPTHMTIHSPTIIEECLSSSNGVFSCIMDFYKKHGLLLPWRQAEEIIEIFERVQPNKWRIQTSYIHHRTGRCVCCQHQMERNEITTAEFEAIQQSFLEQVIVGKNIFYKSSPDEVQHFIKFVQKTGPYDVVIDGLNVLNNKRNPNALDKTVKHFYDQGKKVLILGNKALARYLSNLKRLSPRPSIYMTSTTRADDAFFLYAALQSGKDTLIISRDKLRDHKFHMDPKLRHLFQQWLKSVQIYDWFFSRYGEFTIGRRCLYSIGPHKDDGGWHIPLNDVDKDHPFGNFTVLCIRDTSVSTSAVVSPRTPHIPNERKRQKIHYGKKGQRKQNSKSAYVDIDELMKL